MYEFYQEEDLLFTTISVSGVFECAEGRAKLRGNWVRGQSSVRGSGAEAFC